MSSLAHNLNQSDHIEKPTKIQHQKLAELVRQLSMIAHDKPLIVTTTISAILSSGHILLEDVPGIGKTTFVKGLSKLLGLPMKRIQFTNDMLPADILGSEIYDQKNHAFTFHKGPIFSNILLADELNRASPRTQSALLEAMGEGSVTVMGMAERLPDPFIVIATQNPHEHLGTYPLPESQLDRFSAKLRLDYPSKEREESVFRLSTLDPLKDVPASIVSEAELAQFRAALESIQLSDRVVAYAKRFVDATRNDERLDLGVSTRGGVSWIRMARAKAMIENRAYVVPDDLISLAGPCLAHRIVGRNNAKTDEIILDLSDSVPVE